MQLFVVVLQLFAVACSCLQLLAPVYSYLQLFCIYLQLFSVICSWLQLFAVDCNCFTVIDSCFAVVCSCFLLFAPVYSCLQLSAVGL